jgi:hypothetical protein
MSGDIGDKSPVSRPNWSHPLPRPLVIPKVMTLKTLADVRTLVRHLPKDHRARPSWLYVEKLIEEAAAGADTADVSIALRMVLSMEGVEYRLG